MRNAALHIVQHALRLSVLLVLIGLCTVPVECSAIYGPHSVFVSAASVAALRDDGSATHEAHAHTMSTASASAPAAPMAMGHASADTAHSAASAPDASAAPGAHPSVPTPAGTAMDALVSLVTQETPVGVAASGALPLPAFTAQWADHALPAPEPPPPQPAA